MRGTFIDQDNKPLLILLHAGNSSIEEWKDYVALLKPHFSIWVIYISGHGSKEEEYTSIRDNAISILQDAKAKYEYCYCYGRGLGAQIVLSMLEEDKDYVKKAVLESPLCVPVGYLKLPIRLYTKFKYKPSLEDEERGICLSKAKHAAMVRDNLSFLLDERIQDYKGKIMVLYASNEDKLIVKSATMIASLVKDTIKKAYPYGHLLGLNHFEEISPIIEDFLINDKTEEDAENTLKEN